MKRYHVLLSNKGEVFFSHRFESLRETLGELMLRWERGDVSRTTAIFIDNVDETSLQKETVWDLILFVSDLIDAQEVTDDLDDEDDVRSIDEAFWKLEEEEWNGQAEWDGYVDPDYHSMHGEGDFGQGSDPYWPPV